MSNWDFCFSAGRMQNMGILKSVLETYYLSLFSFFFWSVLHDDKTIISFLYAWKGIDLQYYSIVHLNCQSLCLKYTLQN